MLGKAELGVVAILAPGIIGEEPMEALGTPAIIPRILLRTTLAKALPATHQAISLLLTMLANLGPLAIHAVVLLLTMLANLGPPALQAHVLPTAMPAKL
jgi:hypothetical protein